MDVRGPTDGQDLPHKVSRARLELLRDGAKHASHLKSSAAALEGYDGAGEIPRLIQQLKAIPEVRSELVAAVAVKLKEGHYSTRESAEKAAGAILGMLTNE